MPGCRISRDCVVATAWRVCMAMHLLCLLYLISMTPLPKLSTWYSHWLANHVIPWLLQYRLESEVYRYVNLTQTQVGVSPTWRYCWIASWSIWPATPHPHRGGYTTTVSNPWSLTILTMASYLCTSTAENQAAVAQQGVWDQPASQ